MANNILNTAELIDKINNAWREHLQVINANSKSMKDLTNSYKLPSNYVQAVSGLKKSYDDADKSLTKLKQTQQKIERERVKELRHYTRLEKKFDVYERKLQREAKALERQQGLYNRVQQRVKALTKEYNDLATKKQLGMRLNRSELSSLDQITKQLNKYDAVLKKVDADVGKHQRNVGNYKSAYDGLGWSVAQIGREMPAFANSLQTGFMAISNNLPMLFDELSRAKTEVSALRAEGKQTTGVLGRLGKALFSFQTLLSVGVTLLTLYGKDIVNWATDLMGGNSALETLSENTRKLNKEANEIASQTIPQFQALVKIATDVSESEERRADAIKELNKNYPDFNANILSEKDNTEAVNKAVTDYILKIGQKAKAQASMNMMQEKYSKLIIAEEKTLQRRNDILTKTGLKAEYDRINALEDSAEKEMKLYTLFEKANIELDRQAKLKIDAVSKDKRLNNMTSQASSLQDDYNDALREQRDIQKEIDALMNVYIDNVQFSTTSTKSNTKSVQNNNREKQKYVDLKTKQFIDEEITATDLLTDSLYMQSVAEAELFKIRQKKQEQLNKYLQSVSTGVLGDFGFDSLNQFFDGTFEDMFDKADTLKEKFAVTFNAIGEVAKEAFSLINQFGQENFNAQYQRLEMQYQFAVDRAGDSATAREEIERQYEQRRKEIQRREAEANKRNALFNIAINTAQGVVSALAMIPPNPVLAGIIAGIGATQLALVSSQQIPQFKDGHLSGTYEGLAITNDGVRNGKPVQEFHERNGVVTPIQGKDTLIKMKRGDKIHKDYDSFMNSLYSELSVNGISPFSDGLARNMMPYIENKGMSKSELKEVMSAEVGRLQNTINNKKETVLNFDRRGMGIYIRKQGRLEEVKNARVTGKGFQV